jgi:hypothetical protein
MRPRRETFSGTIEAPLAPKADAGAKVTGPACGAPAVGVGGNVQPSHVMRMSMSCVRCPWDLRLCTDLRAGPTVVRMSAAVMASHGELRWRYSPASSTAPEDKAGDLWERV